MPDQPYVKRDWTVFPLFICFRIAPNAETTSYSCFSAMIAQSKVAMSMVRLEPIRNVPGRLVERAPGALLVAVLR